MTKRFFSVLALSILVAACGFKLRGQIPIPESLSVMSVESSDRIMRQELVEGLDFAGVTVVQSAAEALAALDLHSVKYDRQVRTIDDRGKVTGYLLIYTVDYKLTSSEGENLRQAQVSTRRDFNFDPEQVLQAEIEEKTLREDMARDLTQQILRQLSTLATAAAPAPSKTARLDVPLAAGLAG